MKKRDPFEVGVSRWVSSAIGVLLALVGSPFLAVGALGIFRSMTDPPESVTVALLISSTLVGMFCVWTGIRMAFQIRRSDGGLLSPAMLRTGGVYFALVPLFLIYIDGGIKAQNAWLLLEIVLSLGLAGACFALANRRQHSKLGGEHFRDGT